MFEEYIPLTITDQSSTLLYSDAKIFIKSLNDQKIENSYSVNRNQGIPTLIDIGVVLKYDKKQAYKFIREKIECHYGFTQVIEKEDSVEVNIKIKINNK